MEARGFVSKFRRGEKAHPLPGRMAPSARVSECEGIIVITKKIRRLKLLDPHPFVTLPPTIAAISAVP
jgi:hypothetical protein